MLNITSYKSVYVYIIYTYVKCNFYLAVLHRVHARTSRSQKGAKQGLALTHFRNNPNRALKNMKEPKGSYVTLLPLKLCRTM